MPNATLLGGAVLEGSSRAASNVQELNRFGAPDSSPRPDDSTYARKALIRSHTLFYPLGGSMVDTSCRHASGTTHSCHLFMFMHLCSSCFIVYIVCGWLVIAKLVPCDLLCILEMSVTNHQVKFYFVEQFI